MKWLLIALLALGGGCVTQTHTVKTDYPMPKTPPRKTVEDKRVVMSEALRPLIQVVGIKSDVGANGYLKIQVDVQSKVHRPEQFSYKIDWFDENGEMLPLAARPESWMLLGGETSFLAETAPTPSARSFRVTFFIPE